MEEQEALLKTIIENPDCDTARLVYADWLEEKERQETCLQCGGKAGEYRYPEDDPLNKLMNGDTWYPCGSCNGRGSVSNGYKDRAEFIRVQCELATKLECPDWCDRDPAKCRTTWLEKREKELLKVHNREWFYVPSLAGYRDVEIVVRRGFVESIKIPFQQALDHPEIFRENPIQPTATMVTDREPNGWSRDPGSSSWDYPTWHTWYRLSSVTSPAYPSSAKLADDIFDLLECKGKLSWRADFEKHNDAMIALSRAVIAKARR